MKVAIIGAGQVGLVWADALAAHDRVELSLVDPVPSARAHAWVGDHDVDLHDAVGPWAATVDVVLLSIPGSIVPSSVAALMAVLPSTAAIVDLSTAAADTKRAAASEADARGIGYVDVAITGAVAVHGVRTPLLLAGSLDERVRELLDAVEAPVSILDDAAPGDAVTVKLLRSVIMKGVEALALEALPAAKAYGVSEQLFAALGDVGRSPFSSLLQSMVVSHPQHAQRRHAEVLEASAQLRAVGLPHELTDQVAARFARTIERVAAEGAPEADLDSTLQWLSSSSDSLAATGGAR